MARLQVFVPFLLVVFAESTLGLDWSRLTVHEGPRAAGVFMVTEGGNYAFNFTDATATCQYLNVTIATKAQIEQALAHGLETCKFGWIAEQIAVVPRIAAVKTCGNEKTGVVPWNAEPQKKFGVYCFNASDSEETKSSTSVPQTAASPSSMFILLTHKPTTPVTPVLRFTAEAQSATTQRTHSFSTFTSTIQTTRTTPSPFSSLSPKTLSTSMSTLPPRLLTSLPADVSVTLTVHTFDSSVSSAPASTVNSARPQLGVLSIALIVLCIVVLILTAGGAASYYKWSVFSSWPQGQKDDVETEMWKQTGSEMDLHIQHEQEEEEEEEEADRKYASDATLCMNPDLNTKY